MTKGKVNEKKKSENNIKVMVLAPGGKRVETPKEKKNRPYLIRNLNGSILRVMPEIKEASFSTDGLLSQKALGRTGSESSPTTSPSLTIEHTVGIGEGRNVKKDLKECCALRYRKKK